MRRRTVALIAALTLLAAMLAWLRRAAVVPVPSPPTRDDAADRSPERPPDLAVPVGPHGSRPEGSRASSGPDTGPVEGDEEDDTDPRASLRVVTVDAATGLEVSCTWNVGTGRVVAGPWPPGVEVTEEMERAQEEGLRRSRARWEDAFLPSGAIREAALGWWVTREGGALPYLTIRPPSGYVAPDAGDVPSDPLAAGVRAAWTVVPVHREAVLHLRIEGPDGRAAVGAVVVAVHVAGERCEFRAEPSGTGEFLLRGLPHLAGEPVLVETEWEADAFAPRTEAPPSPSEGPQGPGVRTFRVPQDLSRPWSEVIRLAGATGPSLSDHNESDWDRPVRHDLPPPTEGPVGSLRVRVLGWDGSPIARAGVLSQSTGRDGIVVLPDLPAGEIRLATEPSVDRMRAEVVAVVRTGTASEVVLREPFGGTLDLVVTDGNGDPRPSARFQVTGARVFDVVDGVQRLDRYVDARGQRTLARVEPGDATVTATWGSHRGTAQVTVRDRERRTVRLVLE